MSDAAQQMSDAAQHKTRSTRIEQLVRELVVCGIACLLLPGCGSDDSQTAVSESRKSSRQPTESQTAAAGIADPFYQRAAGSGLDFTYRNDVEEGLNSILESLGGGIGLFDFDNDNDLDVYIAGGGEFGPGETMSGRPSGLFRNERDWKFTDVSTAAEAGNTPMYNHGVSIADYDNDGFPDLLVTGYGALVLMHNQGDGTFQTVTQAAGVVDSQWSSSAGWGDIDNDGDLDLYVAHYVDWSFKNNPFCPGTVPEKGDICSPQGFLGLPDTFFLSSGDGSFTDASEAVGLVRGGDNPGKGLGVLVADVDLDQDIDFYIANDTVPNFLYRNRGDGTLEEVGLSSGTSMDDQGRPNGSMGVDLTDFDRDGLPDIWAANFERESFALYRNMGNCLFLHVSRPTGITAVGGLYVGWGTSFFDLDRDADDDVFVANGHVMYHPANAPVKQHPLLLVNDPVGRFRQVTARNDSYLAGSYMGRGVARGDIDDDGDEDLLVSHLNDPVALLENRHVNTNHWVSVRLIGRQSNRDGIGATVWVETPDGLRQLRQRRGGGSYASTNDPRLFFGLGAATEVVRIEVVWPSGRKQTLENIPQVDRVITLVEPAS